MVELTAEYKGGAECKKRVRREEKRSSTHSLRAPIFQAQLKEMLEKERPES